MNACFYGSSGIAVADVHAYDTHYLLALRLAGSVKTGHHTGACRKEAREARK